MQGDTRARESKRKIFLDQPHRSRFQEHSYENSTVNRKSHSQIHSSHLHQQSKKQVQQLKQTVKNLQTQLMLQREKYDQLFEEYEELIEKNNLIEKEYINLKYQHNKEIKNIKKSFKEKTEEQIRNNVQEFLNRINGENIWEGLKYKIDKFIANLRRVSEIYMQKSKKYHSNDSNTTDVLYKLKHNYKVDPVKLEQKMQKIQVNDIQIEEKTDIFPLKQSSKQNEMMVNSSLQSKQIVFEDEYYGDLQDYQHYQQKIMQRLNYQLMKNCNRSSSQVRRKKIFNKSIQFQ